MSHSKPDIECAWKAKKVNERNAFLFNNTFASDVSFVVGRDAKFSIPAHKVILGVASEVFHAMFFGPIQEITRTIEVPDVEPEAFFALLKYIYTDKIELTDSTLFPAMYVANKYMVAQFEEGCIQYLSSKLNPYNAVLAYSAARRFNVVNSEAKILQVIEAYAAVALKSPGIVELDREGLKCILQRDTLNCKEMEVFECVDKWAEEQCRWNGLFGDSITGEAKRKILGDLLYLIRFPTMDAEDFATGPALGGLLTKEEVCDVLLHFHSRHKVSTPFPSKSRQSIKSTISPDMRLALRFYDLRTC